MHRLENNITINSVDNVVARLIESGRVAIQENSELREEIPNPCFNIVEHLVECGRVALQKNPELREEIKTVFLIHGLI